MRHKVLFYSYFRLVAVSAVVAVLCCSLAFALKELTEYIQHSIVKNVARYSMYFYIGLPSIGITAIYFLRKYVFHNRQNKGIKEIYTTLETRKDHLPFFKITSHFINGFLTVVFGGSTGIEVSTVVSTATIGNQVYKHRVVPHAFKKAFICAGVTAGVAVLFGSAIGGWLFAIEIIAKKFQRKVLISSTIAAGIAFLFIRYVGAGFLIPMPVMQWQWKALPYMVLLAMLAGLLATYFTHIVLFCKRWFSSIPSDFLRVNLGALAVGLLILCFPALYGDSYHGLNESLKSFHSMNFLGSVPLSLAVLALLKPITASLTLGAGGDGGVFAPSIVAGAFLGMLVAYLCNRYFGFEFVLVNFALIGAAAMLAAAIHGPVTAVFLIGSLAPHGYQLFFPLAIASCCAYVLSKKICQYNVYSYPG